LLISFIFEIDESFQSNNVKVYQSKRNQTLHQSTKLTHC